MNNEYLETVPDDVAMIPDVFIALMKKFRHHRYVRYGFSKKHTKDIEEYRRKTGLKSNESSIPSNVYRLPITYNTDITYVK